MNQEKTPASKELQDADAALRRAAHTAKKLAEQNGTPYVVMNSSDSEKLEQSNSKLFKK